MNSVESIDIRDGDLAGRLRRLDAVSLESSPGFDYEGLLERQTVAKARAAAKRPGERHRERAGAGHGLAERVASRADRRSARGGRGAGSSVTQPRLVRADTYLALAALEDHIATIDDALNDARLMAPRGAEVARLERTRAELMDSYTQVRYAEMVSNNF